MFLYRGLGRKYEDPRQFAEERSRLEQEASQYRGMIAQSDAMGEGLIRLLSLRQLHRLGDFSPDLKEALHYARPRASLLVLDDTQFLLEKYRMKAADTAVYALSEDAPYEPIVLPVGITLSLAIAFPSLTLIAEQYVRYRAKALAGIVVESVSK